MKKIIAAVAAFFMVQAVWADEIVDRVDAYDNVIGQIDRAEVDKYGLYPETRGVWLLIKNSQGQLLVNRRGAHKKRDPLALEGAVAGAVETGETYEQSILREIEEELGWQLSHDQLTMKGYFAPSQKLSWTHIKIYEYICDEKPPLNLDEFCESMWLYPEEIVTMYRNGERMRPTLPRIVRFLYIKGAAVDCNVIIPAIAQEVKQRFEGEGSGHDWWHIYRVWKMAQTIGTFENADMLVVELAALLHDVADWKFHAGDESVGPRVAREIMEKHGVPHDVIEHVCTIIATLSYKGAGVPTPMKTLEGAVVQDADRLDAIGAIGIGRTFAYGGHTGNPMHNPESTPTLHTTKQDYFKGGRTTVNHFYEKLLLLKDRMNTNRAKELAQERHVFMEQFLERFYGEWDGNQ